jgi:hypothetical protein
MAGKPVMGDHNGSSTHFKNQEYGRSAGSQTAEGEGKKRITAGVFFLGFGPEPTSFLRGAGSPADGGNGKVGGMLVPLSGGSLFLLFRGFLQRVAAFRRSRHGSRRIADDQAFDVPETKYSAITEHNALDTGAIDDGSIGGTQIVNLNATITLQKQFAMIRGNRGIRDDNVIVQTTTDACMINREFKLQLLAVWRN